MREAGPAIPVDAFTIGGSIVIGTDDGQWLELGAGNRLEELPATGPTSAAVDCGDGTVLVAGWEPVLRRLRERRWVTQAIGAPAIALAVTARGLVIADAGGALSLIAGGSGVPVQELAAREPVVALVALGDGVAVLTASGRVEATAWPAGPAELAPIETQAVGRVHALFAGIRRGRALVAGARGLGVIDGARSIAITTGLGDRVAGAVGFGDDAHALVFGDHGEAWIVDEQLTRTARVGVAGAVIGAATSPGRRVLAWTAEGALHAVEPSGASRRIADGNVVLATPEPDGRGALAVRWSAQAGVSITRGHAWS